MRQTGRTPTAHRSRCGGPSRCNVQLTSAARHFSSLAVLCATRWAWAFLAFLVFLVGCAAYLACRASPLAVALSTWACCVAHGASVVSSAKAVEPVVTAA